MIELLVLLFLAGVTVKIADEFSDVFEKENYLGIIFGIIYGFLLGYAMSVNEIAATVFLGVITGVAVTKKLDSFSHLIGLFMIIFTIIFLGNFKPEIFIALVLFIAIFADEKFNDYFDRIKGKGLNKLLGTIAEFRLTSHFITIIISFILMQSLYWFSLLSFDLGYQLVTIISEKIKH
ncbi:MAG: hypothetical protein ABIH20_01890 [Candidatus Diapherotrites archaeon]